MKSPRLKYFDNNKAVTVSVDASTNGLGAVLFQEGQLVAYGSVSLMQTQQRYAQIEKELLAVIYGLEHFNYYTYGRIVTVQTDHKPIQGLSKKPYDTISPRLQRMLFRLNKYNIQLEYVPGKNLVIADALSRAQSTINNFDEVLGQEATVRINLLTQASPTEWEEITKIKTGDPEMQDVLFHINNGWPEKKKTEIAAQPYWHCKKELFAEDSD
ncbi:retrovirus-related Pol polyprotein from transposon opus [Nephila pilipes]|uniref:Retrovirus-related Pol polyprotein from transposon opus n=1 Tax=Nephila pilipes TaxID=299642 RepID=A0A8X6MCF8_NEPPI|nr:retrovirus-related Pol polyprotein from transposon opus [Nephila pilipes]